MWLTTRIAILGGACGFERYLQLATQEVAIRLHRELASRETVGVRWIDGYDPRYPESMWEPVTLFQFTPSGDEFLWDYFPKHFPDLLPLFQPHADARLEAEVTHYEKWLKQTYCQ